MQKLKEANLYQSELVSVSGKLVERYNACLEGLGFSKTKLSSFSIDGIGWSPEIAEEKDDVHYLNNGEANSHGIIITPKQKGLPVYVPFHSFDRDLMKLIFKTYESQISDITRDCAIYIDFDQKIDVFYNPLDVLKYQDVTIAFHLINELDKAQKEQEDLIDIFNRGNNFIEEEIHRKLLDSARKYGDLRGRDLSLEEIHFTTSSFYTKAYGGMYLLRDFISPILVFESQESFREASKNITRGLSVFYINQPELVETLEAHSIIQLDLEKTITEDRYDRIKKYVFTKYLYETEHLIQEILTKRPLFKRYLNGLNLEEKRKVMGVEIYLDEKKKNPLLKAKDMVDEQLLHALYKPHFLLKAYQHDLIWKLLINISPRDILFMYWYDKEEFYKQFKSWDDSMKDWSIETICKNI